MKKLLAIITCALPSINICVGSELAHNWSDYDRAKLRSLSLKRLPATPADTSNRVANNPDAASLGHKIFFDPRFSANGKVSCASCHQPEKYFTDGRKTAQGIGTTNRNAPTVVGTSYSNWFFHDGRADSLWSQALGPLEDSLEHGANRGFYAHVIYSNPDLKRRYENVFGVMPELSNSQRFPEQAGPVKDSRAKQAWLAMAENDREAITEVFVNMAKSLAAYETLLKPAPARFDKYVDAVLTDDNNKAKQVFSNDEAAGLRLFINKANCIVCHNGPLLTDFEFHNTATPPINVKAYDWGRSKGAHAVLKSEFNCRGKYNDSKNKKCDDLEYIVTDRHHTIGSFRTPTLRNVSKTAPYMHAGQYKTISDVIKHYNEPPSTKIGQSDLRAIPIDLDNKEVMQLEAFIKTLASEIDADRAWLRPPE